MKMAVSIDRRSLQQFRAQWAQSKRTVLRAIAAELYRQGELIMGESKQPYNVPIDQGILRNSGQVQLPKISPGTGRVRVVLGYGGAASAYAAYQHENLALRHPGGGRAKYLEIPAMERASVIGQEVGAAIARHLAATARGAR